VHFGIKVFQWGIAVQATLWGIDIMVGVRRLPHQPSHAVHEVSTAVFDVALVIVIPFHILESV
jgi:hypothetical protein